MNRLKRVAWKGTDVPGGSPEARGKRFRAPCHSGPPCPKASLLGSLAIIRLVGKAVAKIA